MADAAKKFADVVVARFSGKKPAAPVVPPDDAEPPGGDAAEGADMDDQEAAEQGKVALAAVKQEDPVALREAIKAIVHECMEEYGVGK